MWNGPSGSRRAASPSRVGRIEHMFGQEAIDNNVGALADALEKQCVNAGSDLARFSYALRMVGGLEPHTAFCFGWTEGRADHASHVDRLSHAHRFDYLCQVAPPGTPGVPGEHAGFGSFRLAELTRAIWRACS